MVAASAIGADLCSFYFGPPGRGLFGCFAAPQGAARRAGVVLCNPIGDDSIRAHRPLRHLAERLAREGFAVLRFDFHGTGDSDGDERQPDRVKTWLEDVRLAADELRARSGVDAIALVGLRLGATLATAAAAEARAESVVLWAPFPRGSAFAIESTRLHKMHRMLEPQSFAGGPRTRSDGEEALGFLITRSMVADLEGLDLRALRDAPARRALFISDGSARSDQEIVDHLGSLGVALERHTFAGSQQFLIEVPHKSKLPEDPLRTIVTWLSQAHPTTEEPARATTSIPSSASAPPGEEPIVFGRHRSLVGVLHAPLVDAKRELPPILLTSAGVVHRVGPHRMYVGLARRWARLGFSVLRVDLSGIGDSRAGDDGVENVTYPRDGYRDLDDAMTVLGERTGAQRFIAAGLCSGGDFAFQLGIRDPRVVGSVIMNPRTFCVLDLALIEGADTEGRQMVRLELATGASVPASLRSMIERGVDTLLVVGEKDPGVHYVDTHSGDEMRALKDLPGFHRDDIAGTDHNFTSIWSQETVSELVTQHLIRRYLT